MTDYSSPPIWLILVFSLGLVILSAKSHGRALRLERQFEGHYQVKFGDEGRRFNHPWVEALWHGDRVRVFFLWLTFVVGLGGYFLFAPTQALPPAAAAAPPANARPNTVGLVVIVCLLWCTSLSLLVNGVMSTLRLRAAIAADENLQQAMMPNGARKVDDVNGGKGEDAIHRSKLTRVACDLGENWRAEADMNSMRLWMAQAALWAVNIGLLFYRS